MLTVMLKTRSDVAGPADPDRGVHQPITRCSTTRPQQPGPLLRYMKIHAGVSTVMMMMAVMTLMMASLTIR